LPTPHFTEAFVEFFPGAIKMARPQFKPTREMRHNVMLGKACGMPEQSIANTLDIDIKTLVKHFKYELEHGPRIIRQQLLAWAVKAALDGKKSAMALVERMTRDTPNLLTSPNAHKRKSSF
jgi:hypothetical protein